jgi:hypothetical protein
MNRRGFLARSAGAMAAGLSLPAFVRAAGDAWGDLVGRFVYEGKAPERKKLKVDKDLPCCGKFDIRDESLIVGADGGLANVFIYVRSKSVAVCPELEQNVPARVTLDNRDCIFQPHCMKIWYTKQAFYTVNSDPVAQNVAFEPLGDVPCNAVIPVGGNATYTFTRRQMTPVLIKCNYHPWESGYILPRENPYVDISAQDGTFRIAKLPAGDLEFQVWHERTSYLDTPAWPKGRFTLNVKPGANDLGTIRLAPAMFSGK